MVESLADEISRLALDIAPVSVSDMAGRILFWTSGMETLTGYASAQAVGALGSDLLQTVYPTARQEIIEAIQRDGRWNGEVSYRRSDGRRIAVATHVVLARSGGGKRDTIVALNVDVTRSKRAESAAVLASIVESSDDAIIGKTLQGVVTSWNAGAERIFGYAPSEMIGRPMRLLFPPHLMSEEDDILARLRAGARVDHFETTRLRKDGTTIDVSISVSPIRDASGQIIGASKIARDVTEQKRVRERLDELQAELLHVSRLNDMSQMATGLAHEINQPLSAISNYISGAQKLLAKGQVERAAEGCARAAEQVTRAGEVIRRLRDFVGRAEARRREENLAAIIEESLSLVVMGAPAASVQIEQRVSRDAATAMVDRVQVQQVIVNLARNALEAMAAGPRRKLTVTTRRADADQVEVMVADTGTGLSEAVRSRLFQPFTTTKETGMGVGLSLCRSIIEMQGGRIWADDNPGGGAVFHFTLPVA